MAYLLLFALVFAINLMPAFGPPTWAVLVFVRLNWHLNPVLLVVLGALAAVSGRYILASAAHRVKGRLPARIKTNLDDAQALVARKRMGTFALFGVFVVSPLPSAQLFVAAGLLDVPLMALSLAFLLGRLVSYSIYVGASTLVSTHLSGVLGNVFGSPWSIAVQVVLFVAVVALPFVHWGRFKRSPTT